MSGVTHRVIIHKKKKKKKIPCPSNTWKKVQSKILIFGQVMAQYMSIWAALATRDEVGRLCFGLLRPYHWS